ncbi:hypothetical protein PoB_006177400 [Plakobranchus ocellatus]|uniref:Uncharacterized protein n=1 Tax=Plakobranchus ocellatus TaxID=259542 RepID=A0AAV4CTM5_9GAST|nr:hypothetical protein PoB_006177400 [Plakobranchus ocellatus]
MYRFTKYRLLLKIESNISATEDALTSAFLRFLISLSRPHARNLARPVTAEAHSGARPSSATARSAVWRALQTPLDPKVKLECPQVTEHTDGSPDSEDRESTCRPVEKEIGAGIEHCASDQG